MNNYILEQVIIFSRHGIRTPLPTTTDLLDSVTSNIWPKWDSNPGYLTIKGGVLETYFGDYFSNWFKANHLNITVDDVFVYANSLHRTVATAQYFTLGAFSGLDIPIKHKYPIERMDPIFDPVITNDSSIFKNKALDSIKQYTRSQNNIEALDKKLTPTYKLIAEILDYGHSKLYKQYQCNFENLPTTIDFKNNQEPILLGPLAIATAVADAFTLQYYSDFGHQDVAWGKIIDHKQWQMITEVKNQYINVLFNSPVLAHHIATPLISFMAQILTTQKHKLNILVGHDSNIASLLGALGFQDYQLPEQHEKTPIGGKVVFQRWRDVKNNQHYFKAEYVYQTFEQIKQGTPLNEHNPPQHIDLVLDGLPYAVNNLYLWQDFEEKILSYL